MDSSAVSPTEALNIAIRSHNPFINAGIVKEQDVWGKGFPDVPTLNAHASNAVFQAIDLVRTSESTQEKVTSIAITAQQGVGKTHILSRIRHQLKANGTALFVYAGVNNYTDLNLVKYQFQQTLADSLSNTGSQGVMQWQEVAAAMANEAQRKHQLEKLEPPLHPELEELQSAIASLAISQPAAKQLDDDIKVFLGWSSGKLIKQPDPDLAWINNIAKLGDRSIEQDEKKSNYQAGTDFENIARQSLEFLGFKVESAYKGGAGGLDLYCSKPYPIVCECKAGKLIPSRTVEELLKLGGMHLGKTQLLTSAKLVIGPGNPSTDTLKAAKEWEVSIINAMTLQKLVEFQAKYPSAINLVELQQYLEPGQVDYKIDEYIDKAEREIKLRSQIITVVKELSEQDNQSAKAAYQSFTVTETRVHYNATHNPKLNDEVVHDLLIELSSPLTGYLGRIKSSDWKGDRFYFLRDLPIN